MTDMLTLSDAIKNGKIAEFVKQEEAPDDEACLNHIMEVRFGMRHVCQACGVEGTFHKLTKN